MPGTPARPTRPTSRSTLWLVGIAGLAALAIVAELATRDRSATAEMQAPPRPAPIDGSRAFGYLKAICALGPRPAGSAANEKQREMVASHFKKHGGIVREQPFRSTDPRSGQSVRMANLVGSWFPERTERVVLMAHYDTRPFPDEEPDPGIRTTPFIGANDGASGVALLMEIAHHLNDSPTPWGVDLVIVNGEELVYGAHGEYFLGSKEFARLYAEAPQRRKYRYAAGMVLDMVADRDLNIEQEPQKLDFAPRLVREVWGIAARLNEPGFRQRVGPAVLDDHLPLNRVGIPAIDIIDFHYVGRDASGGEVNLWHTAADVPENCSAASLQSVGRVVTAWLALPKPRRR